MSVKQLILDYALACNPITINGIYWELDEQYIGEKPQDYEVECWVGLEIRDRPYSK